jgi:hypothetical protein
VHHVAVQDVRTPLPHHSDQPADTGEVSQIAAQIQAVGGNALALCLETHLAERRE